MSTFPCRQEGESDADAKAPGDQANKPEVGKGLETHSDVEGQKEVGI